MTVELLLGTTYGALAGVLLAALYKLAIESTGNWRLVWIIVFGFLFWYSIVVLGLIEGLVSSGVTPSLPLLIGHLMGIGIAFARLGSSFWRAWYRTVSSERKPPRSSLFVTGDTLFSLLGSASIFGTVFFASQSGTWRGPAWGAPLAGLLGILLAIAGVTIGHFTWLTVAWVLFLKEQLESEMSYIEFLPSLSRRFVAGLNSLTR